ncbi:MAG: riboflavin synthase [Longimicrobiales bacterium]
MFTGIVEALGTVAAVAPSGATLRLEVAAGELARSLAQGDSIAIDGVCQTVVERQQDSFTVQAIATTVERTTFGTLQVGALVNLERALAVGQRLGGHLVQGHVDGTGLVVGLERGGEHVLLDVRLPEEAADVTVLRGSIALNGVSLTVSAKPQLDVARVALIPYTWERTNLSRLREGDPVNVEGDMVGRFVVDYLKRIAGGGVEEAS